MKTDIKELWVAALESGEYEQTVGRLRKDGDKFCCLGVLCNLHAQAHPDIAAIQKSCNEYMGCTAGLPEAVMKWAGINDSLGGNIAINGETSRLAGHNDRGRTFKEIAQAIRDQL